jgi:hypothetical protein
MADSKTPSNPGMAERFLGSLKDALAAASRDDTSAPPKAAALAVSPPLMPATVLLPAVAEAAPAAKASPSAAEAAREARAPAATEPIADGPPTTRVVRGGIKGEAAQRTALVRGRQPVKRGAFEQDPVVGWLVVIGGAGIGSWRPIFEGNNTVGRSRGQRIPLDFGDESISAEEQAYIRYDGAERKFLLVPNLAKTNIVRVNDQTPTAAVELAHMDYITLGRTQVVFVPFCGPDFDWGDIQAG